MLTLLVVEDHALVREGLLQTLKNLETRVATLGAANAAEALACLEGHPETDLVLLDLMLPDSPGLGLLGALRKRFPSVPVVILSALEDNDTIARCVRSGASGFVPKSSSTAVLLSALRSVLDGEVFLPPRFHQERGKGRTTAERFGLTVAQTRVLDLLSQGKTNRQIGDMLDLTEGTVKIHVSAILKALNVANRAQALLLVNKAKRARAV
ncbi:MAG TPA: response regulator transcription factor [Rhodocyclaceae bacterium]|nr:response regulator transcription factor [Rhodocyclaceae bacterium]